jgi:hypothetical protein
MRGNLIWQAESSHAALRGGPSSVVDQNPYARMPMAFGH